MNLLITSTSASSSEPQVEEFPIKAPKSNPKPSIKTNMVAREVWVKVTGAHPGKSACEHELFTEDTTSVLVCENGGVIRLSANVAPGQLLLLTNVESKHEVVVQVTRKQTYQPTSYFVELKFAELVPHFWGMEFSAASALLPKATLEIETAAMVLSAKAKADEPGEPPPAPHVEEMRAFKREVEAVREQRKLMQTPATNQQASAPLLAAVPDASPPLAAGYMPSMESNSSSGSHETPGVVFAEKFLPIEIDPVPAEWTAAEQLELPKPSLDFSMSMPKGKRSGRARGSFTPGFRGGALRLAMLATALVLTIAGAAWYKNWIPRKSAAKKPSVRVPARAANAETSLLPASQEGRNVHSEFGETRVASDAPVTSPGAPPRGPALHNIQSAESVDEAEPTAQLFASSGSEAKPTVRKTSPSTSLEGNRSTTRPTARVASNLVSPGAVESIMVPPKLIKSMRAVASLEALRDFETGNVVIDAVVGTAGEVNFISVLSGPTSLRGAAVEALKQYRYEPAMRNGQPVPAHVNITIHFRFEP
jgi:TonB family protein